MIESDKETKAKAESFKSQGNTLLLDNKLEESYEMYTKAICEDPNNAMYVLHIYTYIHIDSIIIYIYTLLNRYWVNRATVLHKLSRSEDALDDLEYAVALSPNYMKGYFRYGVVLYDLKKYTQAMKAFTNAKNLCNSDDTASYNRIQVWFIYI